MIVLVELPLFFGVLSVVKALQLLNIYPKLVALLVSKLLKSKLVSFVQLLNILSISVTFCVTNLLKSKLVSFVQ